MRGLTVSFAAAICVSLVLGPGADAALAAKRAKLKLTIQGVDQGMVTLSSARATRVIEQSATLRLPAGRYRLWATEVGQGAKLYYPQRSRYSFRLKRGKTRAVTVVYSSGESDKKVPADPVPGGDIGRVVELVNQARASQQTCGSTTFEPAPALKYNNALARAAQLHAEDMAANDYLSHVSLDGRTVADRIAAAGYPGDPGGENIARGVLGPDGVVRDWLDSPVHCRDLMEGGFQSVGVGLAYRDDPATGSRVAYWVQDFGWD